MSAHSLIAMLKSIGYPDAHRLDPHSLDWAFQDPATAPFMQWACSIGKENVLRKEEIEEYEKMMKDGKVLTGSHLQEALAVSASHHDEHDTDDADSGGDDDDDDDRDISKLKSEVEQLKETLHRLHEEKTVLAKERQQLDAKQLTLRSRLSRVDDLASKVKRGCDDVVDASSSYSAKIDEALKKLTQSVTAISHIYTAVDSDRGRTFTHSKIDVDAKFLSQANLSRYHQAEERFSQDLTAYTKKRFFEGMANMTGPKETEHYSLLDVSQPEDILVGDEEDKDSFLEDCREFALLQQIFPQSEINRLNALVNTQRAVKAVQEAKAIIQQLKTNQFPTSSSTISHLQSRAEQLVHQSQDDALQYQSAVPDLVRQLGTLQGTEILTGNYELKLKRQDYFTRNQGRIIEYLEAQRSRSELLLMFYDLELKFHERTHFLLSAAEKMLQCHLQDWKHRMKLLDDPDLSRVKFERNVVDARDTTSNSIYQMMSKCSVHSDQDSQLYLPVSKVKDTATSLYSSHESSQALTLDEDEALKQNMGQLEDCVKEGEATLFADSSTWLPTLSPADVQASMASLQGHISSLTPNVERVVKNIKQKKKLLKDNPVLTKQREMFSLFHTKPDRLISTINALEDKLKISHGK